MSYNLKQSSPLFQGSAYADTLETTSPKNRWRIMPKYVKGSRVSWMTQRFGLKWTDLRRIIAKAFVNTKRNKQVLLMIKQLLFRLGIVPVRTGKLLDTILTSLRFTRAKSYNSRHFINFIYNIPADRPIHIRNPRHSPPAEGYGEWGTYKLNFNIPNVQVIRITAGGNALYRLNDPVAMSNPHRVITRITTETILEELEQTFGNIVITAKLGNVGRSMQRIFN